MVRRREKALNSNTPPSLQTGLGSNRIPSLHLKQEEVDAIKGRNIVLRFDLMEQDGPFGFESKKIQDMWKKMLPKLEQHVTSMTFEELIGPSHHPIPWSSLSKKAKKRLRKINHEYLDLFSLRFSSRPRVFGIREHNTLSILWLDPKHEVCTSKK